MRVAGNKGEPRPRALALGWVIGAGIWIGFLAYLVHFTDVRTGNLLRDAVEVGKVPAFSGFFSTLGVMGWGFAAGACFLAAVVCSREGSRAHALYLGCTGILVVVAGLDDAFLFHERLAPRRFGISEEIVLGVYVIGALVWFLAFRRIMGRTNRTLLVVAGLGFAASLVLDVLTPRILFEDGAKYLAIGTFMAFCLLESARSLIETRSVPQESPLDQAAVPPTVEAVGGVD